MWPGLSSDQLGDYAVVAVDQAIYSHADDMLLDLVYEVERELNREVERRDPL